jgi:hypothetical protein
MSDSASDLFPSSLWTGFFLDRPVPGRHQMELRLTFAECHFRRRRSKSAFGMIATPRRFASS